MIACLKCRFILVFKIRRGLLALLNRVRKKRKVAVLSAILRIKSTALGLSFTLLRLKRPLLAIGLCALFVLKLLL